MNSSDISDRDEDSNNDDEMEEYEDSAESIESNPDFREYINVQPFSDLENLVKRDEIVSYDPLCVRKKSNWAKMNNSYKFDTPDFDPAAVLRDMSDYSPKLVALLQRIEEQDKRDLQLHGKLFKHFIFSDLKSGFGGKILAAAFIAKGMRLGYSAPLIRPSYSTSSSSSKPAKAKYGKLELKTKQSLQSTPYSNFYLLSSIGVYDKPISVSMKKQMLQQFNERPDPTASSEANIHGQYARFIIMDSGFKEGIDLFDIKYIHIFEPQFTMSDQKQVIGRGTRTCGQKGLQFHPTKGWPLYVTIYDTEIPEILRPTFITANSLYDLYLKSLKLDLRLFQFSADLEETTILGSVDYELNQNIHQFSIGASEEQEEVETIQQLIGDMLDMNPIDEFATGGKPSMRPVFVELPPMGLASRRRPVFEPLPPMGLLNPQEKMGYMEMREYIRRHFSEYSWDDVKMENLCGEIAQRGGADPQVIQYTPTQNFISHYFTPENRLKGMLLWNSVGTGKTCTAIATASRSFERQGYTILWVTRSTLKNDIWKNMFDQVCNESIRERLNSGELPHYPTEQNKQLRLLSKAWRIRPMSYKQFSNLVSKQNQIYETLVKINGVEDPLQKTLLIIDEAHKLYGADDLSTLERPDMTAFHKALMNSYTVSGKDSVRLMLMTATPIAKDPMEMIKLLNLCRDTEEQFPTDFPTFSANYLDESGVFSEEGRRKYLDEIAGQVSYLNREKDARQFAQPVISYVKAPLLNNYDWLNTYDKKYVREYLDSDITTLKKGIEEKVNQMARESGNIGTKRFESLKTQCNQYEGKVKRECVKIVNMHVKEMVKEVKEHVQDIKEDIKKIREKIKNQALFKSEELKHISSRIENHPEEYAEFKKSLYSNIRKCGKAIHSSKKIVDALEKHPAILQYSEELARLDQEILNTEQHLKENIAKFTKKIKDMKRMLRSGELNELEANVVGQILLESTRELRSLRLSTKKTIAEETKQVELRKSNIKKTKRTKIQSLVKTFRRTMKERKMAEKEIERVENKLRKEMERTSDFETDEQTAPYLRELVVDYKERIHEALNERLAGIIREEEEKQSKLAEKEAEKETKRKEKERERHTRKTEREAKHKEKELERQTRKKEKEANRKTRKQNPNPK
jgi:hypothetical protein